MKTIGVELYCPKCQNELRVENADAEELFITECPNCGSHLFRSQFVVCDCGTTVYLDDPLTNECPTCGKLYNGFGQELAPREEWGDENWDDDY